MKLPSNKTKVVCTIGPASESPDVMERMIRAGMSVARINFSHGTFESHAKAIENLRSVAHKTGQRLAIMGDLPGPKMRIGQLADEPIELKAGETLQLTTDEVVGDAHRLSVSFAGLPHAVRPRDKLYINDGFIELEVVETVGNEVLCKVIIGGELRSRKGLNLPGIDLGINAFTDHDRECLEFAMEHGVDAISQSFVESGEDIAAAKEAARELGKNPFVIAKIERQKALAHTEDILHEADGIMIARGDLGVEMPIQEMAVIQKELMKNANLLGKPVITATQMLESMTNNRRPTRAESTDVANAILDGADCVMLSGESALGKYPVESVRMLAKIAEAIEPHRPSHYTRDILKAADQGGDLNHSDLIALSVEAALQRISPAVVFVPTRSGASARSLTRFRLPVWIVGVSSQPKTCQDLQFSYGVYPVHEVEHPEDWNRFVRKWLHEHSVEGDTVILTEGPSSKHPEANNRMEILDLQRTPSG